MKNSLRSFLPPFVLLLIVFVSMFILYADLQPFVLFDTDDWQDVSASRKAWPLPGVFNPTRVVPQLLMPLCANFSAYIVMPFTGDYIEAIEIGCAIFVSAFVTLYIGMFYALVRSRYTQKTSIAVFLTVFFFLFHFTILKDSGHLFQAATISNVFYYTVCSLLCCTVVLWLMREDMLDGLFSQGHLVKKGIFLAVLYLALISSLFSSIAIAVYVFIDLIILFVKCMRARSGIGAFIKRNIVKLLVLVFWLGMLGLELTGGRSSSLGGGAALFSELASSCKGFIAHEYDVLFCGVVMLILIAFILTYALKQREAGSHLLIRPIGICVVSAVLTAVYLVLLCAASGSVHMSFVFTIFPVFFFVIAATTLCLGLLMKWYPRVTLIVPVMLVFMVFYFHPAPDNISRGLSSATREAVSRDVIAQVQDAVEEGAEEVEVKVPIFNGKSNFPIATYAAHALPRTLYHHGMIARQITAEIVPDAEMNEKYGIPLPEQESDRRDGSSDREPQQ